MKSRVTCCTHPFKVADLNIIYLWKAHQIQMIFSVLIFMYTIDDKYALVVLVY